MTSEVSSFEKIPMEPFVLIQNMASVLLQVPVLSHILLALPFERTSKTVLEVIL